MREKILGKILFWSSVDIPGNLQVFIILKLLIEFKKDKEQTNKSKQNKITHLTGHTRHNKPFFFKERNRNSDKRQLF